MNRIILRPLTKDAWAGIIKYKNCYEDLAPYFTRSGTIYTGLTSTDAERLAKALNLPFINGICPLATNQDYWKTFHVRTSGKDLYLDLDDPMDELKYLFLKNHKRVANGTSDRKPTANFILINQDAEAKDMNEFNRIKRRAIVEFGKLNHKDMQQCLRIFGHNAESLSIDLIESKLFDIVEANPDKFLAKWVDNKTKDTEFLINTAVSKNILRKSKTIYKYGTDVIGHTLEDAIDYLDNPLNQDIKLTIIKGIDSNK